MNILLIILFLFTCYYDLNYRVIPNKLTFPFLSIAFLVAAFQGIEVLFLTLLATLIGLLLLIIPFYKNKVGGGDVKLLATIGSLSDISYLLETFFFGIILIGFTLIILFFKHNRVFPYNIPLPLGVCFSISGLILLYLECYLH